MLITDLERPDDIQLIEEDLLTSSQHYEQYRKIAQTQYDLVCSEHGLDNRDYQPALAGLYCTRKFNLCAGSQGLGKTIISGLTIYSLYFSNFQVVRPGRIHIIAPTLLSASTRWLVDLNKIPGLQGMVEVIRTEKQMKVSTAPIWIYHMEFLRCRAKAIGTNSRPFISRLMRKLNRLPSMVVVDEIHHFRKGSERYRQLKWVLRKAKRCLGLSGTISDGRLDLVSEICELVYKQFWPYTTAQFNKEFGTTRVVKTNYLMGEEELLQVTPRYLSHLAVNKIPAYFDVASRFIHRVTLNDPEVRSAIKLPVANNQLVLCQMQDEHRKAYQQFVRDHLTELQAARDYGDTVVGRSRALSILAPLSNLSSCLHTPNAKMIRCAELVQDGINKGIKTVVFANRVAAGRLINEYLSEVFGENQVVRLYATDEEANPKRLSPLAREEVLSRFLFNPDVVAGVMSINLAGESIDLTQASQIIFYDLPWQVIRINQAISRCERPGAVRDWVDINFLCHSGTIDLHMYSLAKEKTKQSALLLDYDAADFVDPGTLNPTEVINAILAEGW